MIMNAYSVLDKAAKAYLPLFFVRSSGEAIRSFTDAVNDPKHQFARHVDDYALYFVGTFDDSNGHFAVQDSPELAVTARQVLLDSAAPA